MQMNFSAIDKPTAFVDSQTDGGWNLCC